MTMLKRRPREGMSSLVASGMADLQKNLDRQVLNILIDIGLILDALGIKDGEELSYYNKDHKLEFVMREDKLDFENRINYFIFEINHNNVRSNPIFHIIIYPDEIRMSTFQRGSWEGYVNQLAETCRRAVRINGQKEKSEEN